MYINLFKKLKERGKEGKKEEKKKKRKEKRGKKRSFYKYLIFLKYVILNRVRKKCLKGLCRLFILM